MLPFAGILAIAAIGQTLVIQQGGLDLSVPGIFSMGAVLVVTVPGGNESSLIPALLLVGVVGLAGGLINGIAVTRFGITPLVATLGSNAIFIGVVIQVTGGSIAFKATKNWQEFTADKVLGIPILAVIALIAVVLVALFVARTVWGRRFVLIGSSPTAARAAGLSVERYQVGAYMAAGLAYALAGALLSGYLQSPPLLPGNEYLLPSIAAVVLGGTALGGGRGSVIATAVGVLFLSQLEQVISALGAKNSVDYLIQGAIVALGMGLRNVPWNQILPGRRSNPDAAAGPSTSHQDTASGKGRALLKEHKEEDSIDVSKT
ncbi:MAG: ABC transporter permease [Actinobacteria bacterium]|nr:ABC transporter permease [Actinomycetota bacterium]